MKNRRSDELVAEAQAALRALKEQPKSDHDKLLQYAAVHALVAIAEVLAEGFVNIRGRIESGV
jgi:hypothetical protein